MTDQLKSADKVAQSVAAWVGIGGAAFGILSFCMLLGMWFGPLKELPAQYNAIINKLNAMEKRADQADWALESMKSRLDAFAGQMLTMSADREKIWDRLRSVDADATQLKATSLSREDMVEWMAALGARNKSTSVPPLTRTRE